MIYAYIYIYFLLTFNKPHIVSPNTYSFFAGCLTLCLHPCLAKGPKKATRIHRACIWTFFCENVLQRKTHVNCKDDGLSGGCWIENRLRLRAYNPFVDCHGWRVSSTFASSCVCSRDLPCSWHWSQSLPYVEFTSGDLKGTLFPHLFFVIVLCSENMLLGDCCLTFNCVYGMSLSLNMFSRWSFVPIPFHLHSLSCLCDIQLGL